MQRNKGPRSLRREREEMRSPKSKRKMRKAARALEKEKTKAEERKGGTQVLDQFQAADQWGKSTKESEKKKRNSKSREGGKRKGANRSQSQRKGAREGEVHRNQKKKPRSLWKKKEGKASQVNLKSQRKNSRGNTITITITGDIQKSTGNTEKEKEDTRVKDNQRLRAQEVHPNRQNQFLGRDHIRKKPKIALESQKKSKKRKEAEVPQDPRRKNKEKRTRKTEKTRKN